MSHEITKGTDIRITMYNVFGIPVVVIEARVVVVVGVLCSG